MLHAKFQDPRISGSDEEDFKRFLLGMGIAKKSVSRYIAIRDERIAIRITIFYLREFFKCFRVKEVHNE